MNKYKKWLEDFIIQKFKIEEHVNISNMNIFDGIIQLTPAEAAFLLIRFSEEFGIALDEMLIEIGSDISCNTIAKYVTSKLES